MKVSRALAPLACALFLASCSTAGETVVVTATEWVDPDSGEVVTTEIGAPSAPEDATEENSGATEWPAEYAKVLDDPEAYNFNVPSPGRDEVDHVPDGEYFYALVEANGGGAPELLLSSMSSDEHSNHFARVLVFSTDGGSLETSSDSLIYGAAGAGGSRAGVEASQLGRGLFQAHWVSGTGDGSTVWHDVDGAALSSPTEPEEMNVQYPRPGHLAVNWHPTQDRAALDAGELTVSLPEMRGLAPVDEPDVVIEGTVVAKTGAELIDSMPNGEDPASEYFLLQLDAPREFTDHHHATSVYTREAEYVSLGRREISARGHERLDGLEWERLQGERVRLTVAPEHVHFPTDTSMPTGALRVSQYKSAEIL